MLESLSYTKEQLDYFLENLSKYKEHGYSEVFVKMLNCEYLQREIIRKAIKQHEEDKQAFARVLEINNQLTENKPILEELFPIESVIENHMIERDGAALAERIESLNKRLWNYFIQFLEQDLCVEVDSYFDIHTTIDHFNWLYVINFSEKEMVKNAEKVANSLIQENNKKLLKSLKMILGKTIEENRFYHIPKSIFDAFYPIWFDKAELNISKVRRSLLHIYYLSNAGKKINIAPIKEALDTAIYQIEKAFVNNEKISIIFLQQRDRISQNQ